jgi:hypothetical protein
MVQINHGIVRNNRLRVIHPGQFVDLAGSDEFPVRFPHIFFHISVGDDYHSGHWSVF